MTLIPDHFTTVEPMDERQMPAETTEIISAPAVDREYLQQSMRAKPRLRLAKWSQAITWIYVTLEITLGFRVFLKFIAANPLNPFTQFIYHLTKPFVAPFMGLTVTPDVTGAAVLEISTLIGMISYGVMYWLVIRLIWILFNPAEPADSIKYDPDL